MLQLDPPQHRSIWAPDGPVTEKSPTVPTEEIILMSQSRLPRGTLFPGPAGRLEDIEPLSCCAYIGTTHRPMIIPYYI